MRSVLLLTLLLLAPIASAQDSKPMEPMSPMPPEAPPMPADDGSGSVYTRFGVYNRNAPSGVKHDPLQQFVDIFAEERGDRTKVSFSPIKERALGFLAGYVTALERLDVRRLSKNDQLAYWLNLHNAAAIGLVAQQYPVRSVDKIGADPLSPDGPWSEKSLTVLGVDLSLHDIVEHILLSHWDNPDILYGLYQGAADSPKLIVFNGLGIDKTLQAAAASYVNRRGSVRASKKKLEVSSMYRGYGAYAFDDDAEIIAHLTQYAEPKLAKKLAGHSAITNTRFSWKLSDRVVRQQQPNLGGAGFGGGGGGFGGS